MSPSSQQPPDGVLIEAVLNGQRDQFAQLVRRYQAALLRVAEGRLGRRDWAEDVVQETFLCTFRWLESYNSKYSFRTWLWTILLNQCHRHYKRQQRQATERGDADANRESSSPLPAAVATPRDPQSPLYDLLRKERRERLQRMLQQLPDSQADAVQLRFFGELKYQEIADVMQCGLSTAKSRVRWGLQRLSELLEDREYADLRPMRPAGESTDEV